MNTQILTQEESQKEFQTSTFMFNLRKTQYGHLTQTYLDYTASAPYPSSLPTLHTNYILQTHLSNPHSESPPSALSTTLLDQTRQQILSLFRAPEDYTVVFTANATAAAKLVAEAFPFRKGSRLVLSQDNHNSVLGIRCFASSKKAQVSYIPLENDFRLKETPLKRAKQPSLLAYPAQSNFTGVRHPFSLLERANSAGYYTLLDASAYVPTSALNLSKHPADFVIISFYKMFGYPTGVGALIARKEALQMLQRPSFAGGTVEWVSIAGQGHELLKGEEGFHDGTPNFLAIPAVSAGLLYVQSIGMERIHSWVDTLTQQLLDGLVRLENGSRKRWIRIYGPENCTNRGGTIAFDVVMSGKRVRADRVARELARKGVYVRDGCFCNPGCGEFALGFGQKVERCVKKGGKVGKVGKDGMSKCLGVGLGFVRVSLGLGAVEEDVARFLEVLKGFYEQVENWELEGVDEVFY